MKRILTAILLTILFSACSGKKLPQGYTSLSALQKDVLTAIAEGNSGKLNQMVLSQKEFEQFVYPHLPEKERKAVAPRDYHALYAHNVQKGIQLVIHDYKEKHWQFGEVGTPQKIQKTGKIRILKNIPVTIITQPNGDRVETEQENIFSAVIESGGTYRLWTILYGD